MRSPAALEARFATPGYRQLRSVLVLADGRTVLERYYQGEQSDYHHVWSVTKSVMSTLIGIAIAQGKLQGVEQTLVELLPAYASDMSPAVAGTTCEQVLTMTGGFGADPGELPRVVSDWVGEILSEPLSAPGGRFHYANGGSHLLSAILVQATGMSTLDYARQVLFDPLGIPSTPAYEPTATGEDWESFDESFEAADFAWAVDPPGVHTGMWGLRLRAQDLARIGLMYLGNGQWQGRQVVPEGWVREATGAQVDTGGGYTTSYGYQWWVTTADGAPAYAALGTAGQVLAVVPDRDLVVVFQFAGRLGGLGQLAARGRHRHRPGIPALTPGSPTTGGAAPDQFKFRTRGRNPSPGDLDGQPGRAGLGPESPWTGAPHRRLWTRLRRVWSWLHQLRYRSEGLTES